MRRKKISRRSRRTGRVLVISVLLFAVSFGLYTYYQRSQEIRGILKKAVHPAEHFDTQPIAKASLVQLEDYFDHQNTRGVFNGAFLVGRNDSIYLEKSYGYADYGEKRPNVATTSYQLASVSKQFTAVSILILKERKLLKLSDHVVKFFPDFPYPEVTIELLLCHRSGLPNYIYFTDKHIRDKQTPLTNSFIVTLMSSLKPPPYFLPDRTFNYSNTGYAVLAAIVEKVSHMSYQAFVRKEIFFPLGMTHSGFAEWHPSDSLDRAIGYKRGWNEAAFNFLDGVMGDKGIYASTSDLFLWDQALYKGTILSVKTLKDAFEPRGKKADSKKNYGFGWRMMKLEDKTQILYHTGWWEGFQTLLVRIPKDRTTIVVLKNRKAGIIDKAAILKILYPDSFRTMKETDTQLEDEQEGGESRRGD